MGAESGPDGSIFERRIHRGALDRARGASPELRDLLTHVAERRSARRGTDLGAALGITPVEPSSSGPRPDGGPVRVRVIAVRDVGPTLRLIRTERPSGFEFRAGQYVKAGASGAGRSSFSLASAPGESHLELCVGLNPGGTVSPALLSLGAGDHVELVPRAKGSFVLDEAATTHLMVATSTGIGPLRSMLRDGLLRGVSGRFVVLHGASSADRLPYLDELTALASGDVGLEYRATVSGGGAVPPGVGTGRVDVLAAEVGAGMDPSTTTVYACGHPGMIDAVRSSLGALGFTIRSEAFD